MINVDLFDYVMDIKDFKFEEGSEALIELGKMDLNYCYKSKCINLGLISFKGIEEINNYWVDIVTKAGVKIKSVEVCPIVTKKMLVQKAKNWALKNAEKKHKISLKNCFFVGDKLSDIECVLSSWLHTYLSRNRYGLRSIEERGLENLTITKNLSEAVNLILAKN